MAFTRRLSSTGIRGVQNLEGLKALKMIKNEEGGCGHWRDWLSKFAGIAQNFMERPTNGSRRPFTSHLPLFSKKKKKENLETFLILRYMFWQFLQGGLFFNHKLCKNRNLFTIKTGLLNKIIAKLNWALPVCKLNA